MDDIVKGFLKLLSYEMKMGCVNSKGEKNKALRLCRERKRLIKVAIDSRHALVAAHLSYVQSLRNIGVSLRRYAEAEMLIESSLSVSDHTSSQSAYPSSSSPSHVDVDVDDDASKSPLNNESHHHHDHVSYTRTSGSEGVTVMINPEIDNNYLNDDVEATESDASWDFFDNAKNFKFAGHASFYNDEEETSKDQWSHVTIEKDVAKGNDYSGFKQKGDREVRQLESPSSKNNKDLGVNTYREDPSEFITHRAKDFLSTMKVLEHRFVRASESGREVSRLMEANKIKVGYTEAKGACCLY